MAGARLVERTRRSLLLVLFWSLAIAPTAIHAALPVGAEFLVNSFTVGSQGGSSVGVDSEGDFVVVWQSFNQDGSMNGVFGQRFTSGGVKSGVEFQVNSYTSGHQQTPVVAVRDDGSFAVVWTSPQDGPGPSYGIFGRRFASNGAPFATEFQVNVATATQQTLPAIAMEPDGDFVVAWDSNYEDGASGGVFARRFPATAARSRRPSRSMSTR
jgi:hypothetical protein